jgi:hypothetical protein
MRKRFIVVAVLLFAFVSLAHRYHQYDPYEDFRSIDCLLLDRAIEGLEERMERAMDTLNSYLIIQTQIELDRLKDLRENICINV